MVALSMTMMDEFGDARRSDCSPKRSIRSRHLLLTDKTNLSM